MQKESTDHRLSRFINAVRALSPAAWIFLAFFAVMLVQHRFLYFYLDDYGYTTLMFAVRTSTPVDGHAFTLPQLFEFLYLHYQHWGGRMMAFVIQIGLMRWGIWPFRIAQAVVLAVILVMIYRLLQRDAPQPKDRALTALLLCSLYGLISREVHYQGTYWANASIQYVWPYAYLFSAGWIHARMVEQKVPARTALLMWLLYFAAGFSQEQLGMVAALFVLGLAATHLLRNRKKRVLLMDAAALVCVAAGYSILMLAPGNLERTAFPAYAYFVDLSLVEKIRINLPTVLNLMVGKQNLALMLLWVWVSAAVMRSGYRGGKQPRILYLGLYILCFSYAILLTVMAVPELIENVKIIFDPGFNKSYLLFWIGFLAANSLACLLFCLEQKKELLFFLVIGAVGSQAGMLFSPAITFRSSAVFLFALFPALAAMGVFAIRQSLHWNLAAKVALILCIGAAVWNTGYLIRGYAANSPAMEANDQTLLRASQAIQQGADVREIKLRKLADADFAAEVPYAPGYEYINYWIAQYYDLPGDVNLVWE